MVKLKVLLAIGLMFGLIGTAQAAYVLSEDFTDTAWRGSPVLWGDYGYPMVDGTHNWTVLSAQDGSLGRAYVIAQDLYPDCSAALSATAGEASPSSITHAVPQLTSGSVSFTWADGYGNSSIKLQLIGAGDVLASEIHFGNQENMFLSVDSTVFLADDGTSGMYAVYTTPGDMVINFDCAGSGTITADLSNSGGSNFADGMSAAFGTSVSSIEKIRLLADDDGVTSSEINFGGSPELYHGIVITGIPEPATIGLLLLGGLGMLRRRR